MDTVKLVLVIVFFLGINNILYSQEDKVQKSPEVREGEGPFDRMIIAITLMDVPVSLGVITDVDTIFVQ